MILNEVLPLIAASILVASTTAAGTVVERRSSYVAAVVEYHPVGDPMGHDDPVNVLCINALNYKNYIRDAANMGVDIIVFPECGLSTIRIPENRTEIPPFLTPIPDPKDHANPCTSTAAETPEVLKILACAAREARIYVVINIPEIMLCSAEDSSCPADGAFFYNTNVVFDRSGTVISRYRKVNLFGEPGFDVPSPPELSTFDTDFGVTFGTFICFDIYFHFPGHKLVQVTNVTAVVYPVAWFSEYPFLTATQVQMAWSYAMNVTLLAAGYNFPSNRNGGSGIYMGRNKVLDVIMPLNTTNRMLVQRIPISGSYQEENTNTIAQNPGQELIFYENPFLSLYTTQLLNLQPDQATNTSLCNNGSCCNFDLKIAHDSVKETGEKIYYRLAVFGGTRSFFGGRTAGIQVCAVIACSDSDVESCGTPPSTEIQVKFDHVNINGQFEGTEDVIAMPTTLYLHSFVPVEIERFSFNVSRNINGLQHANIGTLMEIQGIAAFGIYTRVYSWDG